jgi:hypothetical protein
MICVSCDAVLNVTCQLAAVTEEIGVLMQRLTRENASLIKARWVRDMLRL